MGIIRRQSIKSSVVRFVSVAVAALATLFVYPLHTEAKGELDAIIGFAMLAVPFATFGVLSVVIRFFPDFKNYGSGHKGYLFFLLLYLLGGLVIFSLIYFFYFSSAVRFLSVYFPNTDFLEANKHELLLLIWLVGIVYFLVYYISNFQRTTVPTLIYVLIPKLVLPILILMVVYRGLSIASMIDLFIVCYFVIVLSLLAYMWQLKGPAFSIDLGVFRHPKMKQIPVYGFYGILGGLGAAFAFQIDTVMVRMLSGASDTGIYTISAFIAATIQVPTQSLIQIAAPIVSQHMSNNNMSEVDKLYKKTSINLLIVGLVLFIMIWSGIEDLFHITPRYDLLIGGVYVVFWMGMAKLVDMATSINGHIISYSKYFRVNLLIILVLAVLNVIFNYIFIPVYGIVGAAMATMLSVSISNGVKFIFVWWRFGIQPFTTASLRVLILGVVAWWLVRFVPHTGSFLLNILLKCMLVLLVMLPPILYYRMSEDISKVFDKGLANIKRKVL